ncbi:MAG TPA: hypothetical protein VGB26_03630 [Nitrospiria bacterium]
MAQGVCDTEVPFPARQGTERVIEERINPSFFPPALLKIRIS